LKWKIKYPKSIGGHRRNAHSDGHKDAAHNLRNRGRIVPKVVSSRSKGQDIRKKFLEGFRNGLEVL
jgi:hypothetical protein